MNDNVKGWINDNRWMDGLIETDRIYMKVDK